MPGLLLHSPSSIVQAALIALGYGIDPLVDPDSTSWQIFADQEPDRPDDCITVYHTTGVVDKRTGPDKEMSEWEGVMIKIRCALEEEGTVKARAIAVGLDSVVQYEIAVGSSNYRIWSLNRVSGPFPLGKENDSSRYAFTINLLSSIRMI